MTKRTKRTLGWLTVLMLATATPALADSHEAHGKGHGKGGTAGAGPSPESRAKMAEAHEKMAACLRSTTPIAECHAQMKKAHPHAGHDCDCAECPHGKGECSEHGASHGPGHGGHGKSTDKSGKAAGKSADKAPTSTPTTSGPTQ